MFFDKGFSVLNNHSFLIEIETIANLYLEYLRMPKELELELDYSEWEVSLK